MAAPRKIEGGTGDVAARTRSIRAAGIVGLAVLVSCARPAHVTFPPLLPGRHLLFAVATWNLHAGRGELRRFIDDLASGALTGAPPRDYVVLLQEDLEGNAQGATSVATARGLSAFFVPVRRDGAHVSGNAIVSTRTLENAEAISLPRERQPRSAARATVAIGGERLFVIDVHFENRVAWWRVLFSDAARGRQAAALLEALPGDAHAVLGGDLNTWYGPTESAWRAMARRFPDTPAHPSEPTFRDRLVLDHLFFDLPDGWTAIRRVVSDSYGSDHHPVVAVVTTAAATEIPKTYVTTKATAITKD